MVGMRTRQLEQQLLSCWISSGCRTHTLGFLFYPPWYPPCPFTLPLFIYLIAIICDIIYSTLSPICNFFLSSRNIICPLTFAPRCCSVAQSCPTLCYPMDCSTPGFPVLHHLPELTQTLVLWVSDTIQPSHPLSSASYPGFSLFQHRGLFQWVSSLYQVAKVLELQYQSFQWIFRVDFL